MSEIQSLGEALPKEMTRVRDVLMPQLIAIGPSGQFALMFMRAALDAAQRAMAEGDVIAMLRCYKKLKEYES